MHPVGKVPDKCRAKRLGTGEILYPKPDWSRCIRFEMLITVVNRLIFQQFCSFRICLGILEASLTQPQAELRLAPVPSATRTEPVIGTRIALLLMIGIT